MPPLRDLTGGRISIPVEVVSSSLFELLVAGWVASDKDHACAHECGGELYDRIIAEIDSDGRRRLEQIGATGGAVWLGLFPTVADLGAGASIDDLVARIRSDGATTLRTNTMMSGPHDSHDDVVSAAAGDADALERIVGFTRTTHPHKLEKLIAITELTSLGDDELLDLTEAALRDLADAARDHLERVDPGLHRDADAARGLALTMTPEDVIETVTNGIEFELRPGIDSVRLIPSAVVRPWSLMLEDGSTQVFIYPASEAHLDGDGDQPPSWLISMYKALGDERRLRILRRIAMAPATFADLVELLGMAKSTVHHHIGILRAAGLVRVSIAATKDTSTYTLRTGVLPEAERLLAAYLTGTTSNQTSRIATDRQGET